MVGETIAADNLTAVMERFIDALIERRDLGGDGLGLLSRLGARAAS